MRTIGKAVRAAVCCAALTLLALPGIPAAAEHGAMPHGDHGGMKMGDHGKMKSGGHDADMGEKVFSGKAGAWGVEARLVDMKAQMEKSGVSAATVAKFAGRRHLMLFVTDPATGKHAAVGSAKVGITGPDKASSSQVTLVVMGEHIGADVAMPAPGKYTFKADIASGGKKGSATFSYTVK
jgi:hypothetical protein